MICIRLPNLLHIVTNYSVLYIFVNHPLPCYPSYISIFIHLSYPPTFSSSVPPSIPHLFIHRFLHPFIIFLIFSTILPSAYSPLINSTYLINVSIHFFILPSISPSIPHRRLY